MSMKYHIITLGCPKNSVDSEGMDGILARRGYAPVARAEDADIVVVNTCSFIAAAREETLGVLGELGRCKTEGQLLIAAGCMAESRADLVREIPGVNATLSTRQWMRIGDLVDGLAVQARDGEQKTESRSIPLLDLQPTTFGLQPVAGGYADWRTAPIRRNASGPSAYLKISDGCNLQCAFCTIPAFKGHMRSKSVDAILGEAQELAAQGVREIILVAQHLTDYGRDLGMQDGLSLLLDALGAVVPRDVWIRLMYAYPLGVTPRLIETMANWPQICHYLDMPLQHAHPDTLRRMRRSPDSERTKRIIADLRAAMPDIALRSTFIVGFPGETTAEFRALLDFLAEVQFDRVGAFRYSQEPETPAAALPDQVLPRVIERRWHEVMRFQQAISLERNRFWQERELDVLIEAQGCSDDGRPLAIGRSFRDAPEIDGQVFVWGSVPVGNRVRIRIAHVSAYDVWGRLASLEPEDVMDDQATAA